MSEHDRIAKSDIEDQADLLSEVIDELRYRPENPLDAALALYSDVQGEAWRQYQNILRTSRVVWEDDCRKAYTQMHTAIATAWGDFQDNADDAWEMYRTGISFYDHKLHLVGSYTWHDYAEDTADVWHRYALETFPVYELYSTVHQEAEQQLDFATTDATLRYKREAREAWTKYQSLESPAWADLQWARKELRSDPDLSLERFEE